MKTILLLRHAKSDWDNPNLADFDRPLAERGLTDAPRMGGALLLFDMVPDKILSSPANRAKQTAKLVAEACGYSKKLIQWESSFYEGSQNDLMVALKQLPDTVERVLLVGHNPSMEAVVARLCTVGSIPSPWGDAGGQLLSVRISTGGLVCLEVDIDHWESLSQGNATLTWLLVPKLVKALYKI